MWWKVALGTLLLMKLSIGSPLSGLYNNDIVIEQSKHKVVESELDVSSRFEPTTYRLSNNSIPLNYDLFITTDIDKGLFSFTGVVKIHIQIVNESEEIVMHYRQMTIDVINLMSADGSTIVAEGLPYEQLSVYEFLVITLPNTVYSNDELVLEIRYNGTLRTDGAGFYRGSYVNAEGDTVWYATTQFEIDNARHAMPCYDEPGIRTPIDVTIKHGRGYTALSNTDVESITEDGDYLITKFWPTLNIQTYLLAFLVSDFDYVNATNTRIPQKIYARPELISKGFGDFAAAAVGPLLRELEDYFGVDYPESKMDHAGMTLFNYGAMENIGLITYTEGNLLYDPSTEPNSQESIQMGILRIIAHEYVHQWFGNIVSPSWWQYVWLNEGFATLFQSYILDRLYPGMNYMHYFVTWDMPRAFTVDVLSQNSWAMNHYTEEPARLWSKFGGIGYQKSGCVIRMFQETLTPATFAKGLNYYQNKMYMKAATPDDLHSGLQQAYDEDYPGNNLNISELMHSWEDRPGYPMISVRILDNNLVFSQRRYPGSAGEIYSVPITTTTKSDPNFNRKTPTVWLHGEEAIFAQSHLDYRTDDWIILNTQQIGYYRVDYDTKLWHAIIKQLMENHSLIHPINRAVLQDEIYLAFTDASLNRVNVSDCMNILSYFGSEDEPIAWSKANSLITLFNSRLFGTSKYEDFLEFLRGITAPHLSVIGYEPDDYEPSVRTSLRSSTKSWNCLALDDTCLTNEYEKFLQFYNTGSNTSFDYCHALRNLNGEIYQTIVDGVATDENYPSRTNYLSNLGCSLEKANLKKLLQITLNPMNTLTANERQSIFAETMGRSLVAFETTIEFIDENYAAVNAISSLNNILQSLAQLINSNKNADELETLLSKLLENDVIINGSEIRRLYIDRMAWHDVHFPGFIDWFNPPAEETTTTETTNPPSPTQSSQPTVLPTEPPSSQSSGSTLLSFGILIACLAFNL